MFFRKKARETTTSIPQQWGTSRWELATFPGDPDDVARYPAVQARLGRGFGACGFAVEAGPMFCGKMGVCSFLDLVVLRSPANSLTFSGSKIPLFFFFIFLRLGCPFSDPLQKVNNM